MELKAPKNQYNEFGKFHYRNGEDILEAVKPLCQKHGAVLTIADSIVAMDGRHYVKATVCLRDIDDSSEVCFAEAYAREAESKSGMDASQITGLASSYARKYALNALFCIDDVKDADHPSNHSKASKGEARQEQQAWKKSYGKTYILSENGKWYEVGQLSMKNLQTAAKLDKYKGCLAEIQKAIMDKQVNDG